MPWQARGRPLQSSWEPLAAKVTILTFLQISGKIHAEPATFVVDDPRSAQTLHYVLGSLDRSRIMRIYLRLLILYFRNWNRLHWYFLTPAGLRVVTVLGVLFADLDGPPPLDVLMRECSGDSVRRCAVRPAGHCHLQQLFARFGH